MNDLLDSGQEKEIFLLHNVQTGPGAYSFSYTMSAMG
jgi:hypothetical protein